MLLREKKEEGSFESGSCIMGILWYASRFHSPFGSQSRWAFSLRMAVLSNGQFHGSAVRIYIVATPMSQWWFSCSFDDLLL